MEQQLLDNGLLFAENQHRDKKTFPIKLIAMLDKVEDLGQSSVIRWLPHGRTFKVYDKQSLIEEVLPQHFGKRIEYNSFHRQLNLYGFLRLINDGPNQYGYYHPLFLRGRDHLCRLIPRNRIASHFKRRCYSHSSEPNFDNMVPLMSRTEAVPERNDTPMTVQAAGLSSVDLNPPTAVLDTVAVGQGAPNYTSAPARAVESSNVWSDHNNDFFSNASAWSSLSQSIPSPSIAEYMQHSLLSSSSRDTVTAFSPFFANNAAAAASRMPSTTTAALENLLEQATRTRRDEILWREMMERHQPLARVVTVESASYLQWHQPSTFNTTTLWQPSSSLAAAAALDFPGLINNNPASFHNLSSSNNNDWSSLLLAHALATTSAANNNITTHGSDLVNNNNTSMGIAAAAALLANPSFHLPTAQQQQQHATIDHVALPSQPQHQLDTSNINPLILQHWLQQPPPPPPQQQVSPWLLSTEHQQHQHPDQQQQTLTTTLAAALQQQHQSIIHPPNASLPNTTNLLLQPQHQPPSVPAAADGASAAWAELLCQINNNNNEEDNPRRHPPPS